MSKEERGGAGTVLAGCVLLLLTLLLVGGWWFARDNDAASQAAFDVALPQDAEAIEAEVLPLPDPEFLPNSEILPTFAQLKSDDVLAYRADNGTVLVDLASEKITQIHQIVIGLGEFPPYVLLYDDSRTLGMLPTVPEELRIVSSGGRLVMNDSIDVYTMSRTNADGSRSAFVARLDAGYIGSVLDLPDDGQLLEVPGLGLLVITASGNTQQVTEQALEEVSPFVVVDAVRTAWVEQQCSAPNSCTAVVTQFGNSSKVTIPAAYDAATVDVRLSPNADRLFWSDGNGAVIYDLETLEATPLGTEPSNGAPVTWAPGGRYVVWIDMDPMRPLLHVGFTDETPAVQINLAIQGAPATPGSEVVIIPFCDPATSGRSSRTALDC